MRSSSHVLAGIWAPLVSLALGACSTAQPGGPLCTAPPPAGGCWEQLRPLGSGGFPAEPGSNDQPKWEPGRFPLTLFPVQAFGGDLWMVAQTHAFSSPDGLSWAQHPKADWGERIGQSFAFFRGRVWMFGGLEYGTRRTLRDIWWSEDGKEWHAAGLAPWPERENAAVVVHHGRLWLLGGTAAVDSQFNATRTLNDVWSSEDGLTWVQATQAAPWPARDAPAVVVHQDALHLVGGEGHADVWRSTDGQSWTELTPGAPWGVRHGFGRASFDGKLWVFGGWVNRPTDARNDVWASTDGVSWVAQTPHAPWGPRSPRWIVFQQRLWIFSGKHTGGDDNWGGDIWAMRPAAPVP